MLKKIAVILLLSIFAVCPCWADVTVDTLRCEYIQDPLGIETRAPRLSWVLHSEERGQKQTAYQILVASTPEMLAKNQGDLWDSGKINSPQTVHVEYAGKPLDSHMRCHWKVRLWDKNGQVSSWSMPAAWTMGMLEVDDWQGQWIAAEEVPSEIVGQGPEDAVVLLRKQFSVEPQVKHATVSICGLGYYELFINGSKIGDHKLDPGFTDYDKRVLYVTYDVTDAMQKGENAIGVMLGNGWYSLPAPDVFNFHKAPWTATPRLFFHLQLDFTDGTSKTIVSDASWKWSTGEIVFQSVRGGETHDMRRAKPGWQKPDYDDQKWSPAVVVSAPRGKLVAQMLPPIKTDGEIKAVELTQPQLGIYVYKLAENTAGWMKFTTSGTRGQEITLKCNELLNSEGTLSHESRSHTVGRYQTGEIILKGEEREVFEPRFCYHGFQYVQVEGLTTKPKIDDLVGVRVYTLPEKVGEFSCSNDRLNQLQAVFQRTYLNNLHSIPTDCPHREKMGWMDDGCVCEELGIYNYQVAQFYTKWFYDMVDSQDANGHVPVFVPTSGFGKSKPDGSPGRLSDPWWGGAIVITPWHLYQYYGDRRLLSDGYDAMKGYVDYLTSAAKDNVIEWGLGDWLDEAAGGGRRRVPVAQTSTACYFYTARIVSQSAAILGKSADAEKYALLAESIRRTYNKKFLNPQTGLYAKESQTAQALPLYLGIVPEEKRALVLKGLLDNITGPRKGHVSTGIVGTLYLFHCLTQCEREDLLYTMLTKETYPGWLNMLNHGATTLWEAWTGEASRNHPVSGCVGEWLYQGLAGIRPDPTGPGFKKIIIKPAVVGDLKWVKATYNSIRGPIATDWEINDKHFKLHVDIPVNTTATVYLPAKSAEAITESGNQIAKAQGVQLIRMEDNKAVLKIESGKYKLQSEP